MWPTWGPIRPQSIIHLAKPVCHTSNNMTYQYTPSCQTFAPHHTWHSNKLLHHTQTLAHTHTLNAYAQSSAHMSDGCLETDHILLWVVSAMLHGLLLSKVAGHGGHVWLGMLVGHGFVMSLRLHLNSTGLHISGHSMMDTGAINMCLTLAATAAWWQRQLKTGWCTQHNVLWVAAMDPYSWYVDWEGKNTTHICIHIIANLE